ncbi:MAG: S8 family serine peptidase [Candidatus Sericytochromatia bacterium]|nr:S8 family serine peptidase [Candidatus Sericytochromatia bacterium]
MAKINEKTDLLRDIALYFSEYMKILNQYQYQKLDKKTQSIRKKILIQIKEQDDLKTMVDYVSLMLYYGTKLTSEELIDLKLHNVISVNGKRIRLKQNESKSTILLDEECSDLVIELIKMLPKNNKYLLSTYDIEKMDTDNFYRILQEYPNNYVIEKLSHCFPIYTHSDYEVIPTPLKLNADMRYTGKGVTIAFIDSGFYPHPDITQPQNRVLKYVNIAEPEKDDFKESLSSSWHGMQTSLSAAGNGFMSGGLYKGIASEANLVLLKVTGANGIETANIIKAIEWCIRNKEEYNIRILNISLGGDQASSYLENALDQAAEGAVQSGITVLVAAGNDGDGYNIIAPPASAPSVITVGGLDDKNRLNVNDYTMYRSSYGTTLDGLLKPEIIAPGIWVAAPILPDTKLYEESEILNKLKNESEDNFLLLLEQNLEKINLDKSILNKSQNEIRKEIENRIKSQKIVGTYYQHVDGTSFSSPIVASVIAQMIEANPALNPRRIKHILTQTTDKLFNVPTEKQGYGMIHARKAVKEALNDIHRLGYNRPMSPCVRGNNVTFYCINQEAISVALVGDFNGWNPYNDFLIKEGKNLWKLEKELQSIGNYRYKFVIDGHTWTYDQENENKEPDGFGGFNNRLNIFI